MPPTDYRSFALWGLNHLRYRTDEGGRYLLCLLSTWREYEKFPSAVYTKLLAINW